MSPVPDIISNHKRVQLFMQVFKANKNKPEEVMMDKLNVWWHFVLQLGDKASSFFDPVSAPNDVCSEHKPKCTTFLITSRCALHCCSFALGTSSLVYHLPLSREIFGLQLYTNLVSSWFNSPLSYSMPCYNMLLFLVSICGIVSCLMLVYITIYCILSYFTLGSPATPQISIGGTSSTPVPFKSICMKGCEVLALMLGTLSEEEDNPKPKFTIGLCQISDCLWLCLLVTLSLMSPHG